MATFMCSKLAGLSRGKQILFQHQGVHPIRVVARDSLDQVIAVAFVKRHGGRIVYRCLQVDSATLRVSQALLGGRQKLGTNPGPSSLGGDIDGDDVPEPIAPGILPSGGAGSMP